MAKPSVRMKQSDPPVAKEILAEAITKISEAMTALLASGINEKAIIILIQAESGGMRRDQIKLVLDNLKKLKGWYCR